MPLSRQLASLAPLLLLAAACASAAPPAASSTEVAGDAGVLAAVGDADAVDGATPPALPAGLEARVAAALASVALFDGDFPGLSSFRPCVLVFGPEQEHVFQCPGLAGSAGFRAARATHGKTPVFVAPTFTVPGTTAPFDKVKTIVGRVGGNVVLPDEGGEQRPTPFFLVQDLDSLHAHHPAFEDTSAEEWTAMFVHEYLHVFQFGQPDVAAFAKDWPKEWAQRDVHTKFFGDTPAYRDAITREVAILKAGLDAPTRAGSKATLTKWLAARSARIQKFAPAFAKTTGKAGFDETDAFFTFLEGIARYVEVRFLCDRTITRPDLSADPSFHAFARYEGCSATKVDGRDRTNGDFHYQVGALVSAHLDAANPGWKATAFAKPGFLVGEARRSSK